jgi:hypothetical protein
MEVPGGAAGKVKKVNFQNARLTETRSSVTHSLLEFAFPTPDACEKKFNSHLVVPTPCNIESRRWLRMWPATGFELLLGVVVLTADFKF